MTVMNVKPELTNKNKNR